jgi:hypothetical protein
MSAIKPKRRIVPTLVNEVKEPQHEQKGNIESVKFPTDALSKHYQNILNIEKKYVKPVKSPQKHTDHGDHYKYLSNIDEYIAHYCQMKKHPGKVNQTLYAYLKAQFTKGLYYSARTKRFRRYR